MAASRTVVLQSEISLEERAIAHLVGQRATAQSAIKRDQAKLKMARAKLAAVKAPIATGGAIPSGDRFPDVSSFQPRIDLATIRADTAIKVGSLIVFKATEGLDYTDAYLNSRWHPAYQAGFPHRGAYHFLHPSEPGSAQAEYFLNALHANGDVAASDIVICDAEVSDGEAPATVAQCVAEFGAYLLAHCPAKRWLYTGGPFATENTIKLAPYDGHWLPAYVTDPKPYYAFGTPIAWQYTDGTHGPQPHAIEGIGACDTSIIL